MPWSSLPAVLGSEIGQYLTVSEFCTRLRTVCKDWRGFLSRQPRLHLKMSSAHENLFFTVEPSSVRHIILQEGADYDHVCLKIEACFFNLVELDYIRPKPTADDSQAAFDCLLSSKGISTRLKVLRLPSSLPDPVFPRSFSYDGGWWLFGFHLLENLEALHLVMPEEPRAQHVMRSLLRLQRLKELRCLPAPKAKGKNYLRLCSSDLAALITRLNVFDGQGVLVGNRLFKLLKDCSASYWRMNTLWDVAGLITNNPNVRHMALSSEVPKKPNFADAVRQSNTTFEVNVVGSLGDCRTLQYCPNVVGLKLRNYASEGDLCDFLVVATTLPCLRDLAIYGAPEVPDKRRIRALRQITSLQSLHLALCAVESSGAVVETCGALELFDWLADTNVFRLQLDLQFRFANRLYGSKCRVGELPSKQRIADFLKAKKGYSFVVAD